MLEVENKKKSACKTQVPVRWTPPHDGNYKLNVDAVVAKDGKRGLGVIVRNRQGEILMSGCRRVEVGWDVETLEAVVVLFGIQAALDTGFWIVEIEMEIWP